MAESLQLLNRRKKTAKNIAQLARAMEMVSASKIKRAQAAVINNKPYSQRITSLTGNILRYVDMEKFEHPYLMKNESDKSLMLIISPDKGLCGSLNTNLFKKILEEDNKNLTMITLGKKVSQFAARLDGELIAEFNMGTTLPSYSIVYQLIELINQEYTSGRVSSFKILYSEFQSMLSQVPVVKEILPINFAAEEDLTIPYLFEPQAEELLRELLPYYLEVVLYSSVIEAFTSEQAARMMAMQNAKNNALDIADYLTLSYNKLRQERITNELLSLNNAS